jgi:iron complex outermembrane receptor protein
LIFVAQTTNTKSQSMRRTIFLLSALFLYLGLSANHFNDGTGTIVGKVLSADGKPAAEVTVWVKGTTRGTVTNEDGIFEIRKIQAGTYVLEFSYLGFESIEQTVIVNESAISNIAITLKASDKELNAVVITGNKKFRTGRVSNSLRLTTPILQTPQNIQVITKGIINEQQSFDMLEGIQRNVSGAQKMEHWDNYALINMRGSQITAFRNGLNVKMPWGPLTEDVSMVDRIEFVKGPAGFMLSNGEPGGFYNVVTKKPTGVTRGEVGFSLGSFDLYRTTLDLDGKLSKDGKLLYRFNAMGQLKGSHRDFEYNNRYSIVPVIKYLVDDKTAVTLEYTYQFSQMNVIGSNYSFSSKRYADLPRNFTTAEANLDPSRINDNSIIGTLEHRFNDDWKFTALLGFFKYDMKGQSLWPWGISTTNDSLMQRGISVWDALGLNKTGQMFVNGKLVTGSVIHNILLGADMGHKDYYADWNQGSTLGNADFNIYNPKYGTVATSEIPKWDRSRDIWERGVRYNNAYTSFYAQDELAFFENRLRLTLAGRYTTNKDINPYGGSSTNSRFTPRAGLSYSINEKTAAYFVFDQSFVANLGTDWQGNNFAPLTGENIEIGIKRDWFGGKWNSTVAAYRITRNNVLTTDLEHPNPGTGQFTFQRATGQQQTKGVEVDIKGELTRNLEAVINYAFTEAYITKDSDKSLVGNKVPGATRHIQNTWLSYKITEGKIAGLSFSLGYQYQAGRSSWYIFDKSESALPDYFRLDGGIAYHNAKFGVNFNVNNITNKYLFSGAPYGDMFYWQTEPGINTRLTVSYKF